MRALRGGKQRSRDGLHKVLQTAGIATTGTRGLHILGQLAQEGTLCFGARETVAYRDRSAVLAKGEDLGNGIFSPEIVIDGQVVGTWTRTLKRGSVAVNLRLLNAVKKAEKHALSNAAHQYGAFLKLPLAHG